MKAWYTGLGMAGLFFSMSTTAGSMGKVADEPPLINSSSCGKLITLSLGPAWYNQGENVLRDVQFPFINTYVPQKVSGVVGSSELFFALTRPLDSYVSGQLGIAIGYSGNAKQRGTLYIANPPVLSSNYSYQLSNARVALKGKLVLDWAYVVQPYVSASAGVGFNRSWNYGYGQPDSVVLPFLDIRPYMADNTALGFSYTAGLGIQGNVTNQWQVGAGYEFTDWGKNNFTHFRIRPNNQFSRFLSSGTFYTNALQLSLTYKFANAPIFG